jgi:hypothetical protein
LVTFYFQRDPIIKPDISFVIDNQNSFHAGCGCIEGCERLSKVSASRCSPPTVENTPKSIVPRLTRICRPASALR